jgi:hypothetical protein
MTDFSANDIQRAFEAGQDAERAETARLRQERDEARLAVETWITVEREALETETARLREELVRIREERDHYRESALSPDLATARAELATSALEMQRLHGEIARRDGVIRRLFNKLHPLTTPPAPASPVTLLPLSVDGLSPERIRELESIIEEASKLHAPGDESAETDTCRYCHYVNPERGDRGRCMQCGEPSQ